MKQEIQQLNILISYLNTVFNDLGFPTHVEISKEAKKLLARCSYELNNQELRNEVVRFYNKTVIDLSSIYQIEKNQCKDLLD